MCEWPRQSIMSSAGYKNGQNTVKPFPKKVQKIMISRNDFSKV